MKKSTFEKIPEKDRLNRVLSGTFYYSSVHRPNMAAVKKFNALPVFEITLGLDAENAELAESYGLKVKPPTEAIPQPHVKITRKVKPTKTADEVKPKVVDGKQNDIPPSVNLGNGSKGDVRFGTYWFDNNGGGVNTTLFKVRVLHLVPYAAKGGIDGVVEDSFSVEDYLEDAADDLADDLPKFDE